MIRFRERRGRTPLIRGAIGRDASKFIAPAERNLEYLCPAGELRPAPREEHGADPVLLGKVVAG